ncbi:MAG: cytochrome c biogenesis protein CcsA [Candidatus Omnitrophota bacterium]|nr:cytochrome c biogenesis protein CcsA [Candidatus Omnitrophota bacterium]
MNPLSLSLLSIAQLFYALTFVLHLLLFSGKVVRGYRGALACMRLGFLLNTFYFFTEAVGQGTLLPVASVSQAMAFFAWSLAFVYLVLFIRIQTESFGLILSPILLAFLALASWARAFSAYELPESLNAYFTVHIVSAFFAYACFTISFTAGVLYLMQQRELKRKNPGQVYYRLPSLEELEGLIYQPMIWGALLLLVAVGVGFFWSKLAYGEFSFLDPKTVSTLVTAALYLAVLFLHYVSSQRGKKVVVLSMVAFGMVLFSFLGTRFLEGSHNFLHS